MSKITHPLKMTPRNWKFAERYNFWTLILYCYLFRTNHKFWPFLGQPRGQKGSKIVHFSKSKSPRSCKEIQDKPQTLTLFWTPIALIITHKSFTFARADNFSWEIRWCHLLNRILQFFELFKGTLGVEWVSKWQKCVLR